MSVKTKLIASVFTASLLPVSLPASAQSHDFASSQFRQNSEARLSLTIPFGTERTDYKAQPRMSFYVRRYKENDGLNNDWIFKPSAQRHFVENVFS